MKGAKNPLSEVQSIKEAKVVFAIKAHDLLLSKKALMSPIASAISTELRRLLDSKKDRLDTLEKQLTDMDVDGGAINTALAADEVASNLQSQWATLQLTHKPENIFNQAEENTLGAIVAAVRSALTA